MSEYIKIDDLDDTVLRLNNDGWGITRNEHKLISNVLYEMPLYSFPEVVHIKDEEELLKRLKECPLEVITPTVVFPEREKGEWIRLYPDEELEMYECSLCCEEIGYKSRFCPNCGADMRGKDNG